MDTASLYKKAEQLHRANRPGEAWEAYQRVLKADQNFLPGLVGIGRLLYQNKKYQEALPYLQRSVQLQPIAFEGWYLLGVSLFKIKDERAIKTLKRAANIAPPKSLHRQEALYQLAKALRDLTDTKSSGNTNSNEEKPKGPSAAEKIVDQLLKLNPNNPKALTLKGQFEQKREANERAYELFGKAVQLMPTNAPANHNFASMARLLKKPEEAERHFKEAIRLNPKWDEPLREYAALLSQEGQPKASEALLKRAIKISPDNPENYRAVAQWYAANGDRRKAIKFFAKTVKLLPEDEKARAALGSTLAAVGAFAAAIPHLKKSLELEPNAEAACALANSYISNGDLQAAIPLLEQALTMDPDYTPAIFQSITLRAKLCDWSQREADRALWQRTAIAQSKEEDSPHVLPLLDMNYYKLPMDIHRQLNTFSAKGAEKRAEHIIKQTDFQHTPHEREKLRIGYASPDFRHHPVGRIVQHIFRAHHRDRVEVYAYSLSEAKEDDDIRRSVQDGVDVFRELSFAANAEVAKQIYADGIDVLIDLGGYTAYARPEVVAAQPAPVQAHFLGYPNTSGADFLQYIIADAQLVPEHLEQHYSEKIVRLPNAFPGAIPTAPDRPLDRSAEGIPEDAFVFAAFNRPEKYDPEIFASWLRIVNRVDRGVLWLGVSEDVQKNLRQYATSHNLNLERVHFSDWADYETFLHRLRLADLFLDTLHYGAGATAVASIAMGTPVLTATRDNFTSRLAATVVGGAGQTELIFPDLSSFEAEAVALARDPDRVRALKNQLTEHPEQLSLFDMDRFASNLEKAYFEIYDGFRRGAPITNITV